MHHPKILSNQPTIVLGTIATMVTILSVVVAVFKCRRPGNVVASRQNECIEARGRDIPLQDGTN